MKEVTLDPSEVSIAACIGSSRQKLALERGYKDSHGFTGLGWSEHIEGVAGEIAVAKVLGLYWGGAYLKFKGSDIGERLQVRTRREHWHELIIRDDDEDDHVFILATGRIPRFTIHGWIYAKEGKREEWKQAYNNRPPAYFVEHAFLHPLSTVPKE